MALSLNSKIPGPRMLLRSVKMELLYGTTFLSQSPEAYERLLLDAMRGDATLFTRNDEAEGQWRVVDPIVQAWQERPGPLLGRLVVALPLVGVGAAVVLPAASLLVRRQLRVRL